MGITLRQARENFGRKAVYTPPRPCHPAQKQQVGTIAGVNSIYVMLRYEGEKILKAVPANCLSLVADDLHEDEDDSLYEEYFDDEE